MNTYRVDNAGTGRWIELKQGDLTREPADALVNAANTSLLGGGGVDGAIHRAAGPGLLDACRKIGGCAVGAAVITPGFDLPARHVIHTVGPVWRGGRENEPGLLRSAFAESFRLAAAEGLRTVAAPAISTGVYRYPMAAAAEIALLTAATALRAGGSLERIRFVLFDRRAFDCFAEVADALAPEFDRETPS